MIAQLNQRLIWHDPHWLKNLSRQNQTESQNEQVSRRSIHEKSEHICCAEPEQLVGSEINSKGLAPFFSMLFLFLPYINGANSTRHGNPIRF